MKERLTRRKKAFIFARGTERREVPLDRILVQLFLLKHKKEEWTAYRDSRTLMQYCPSTEARLTSVFEMGTGEPRPYGRPYLSIYDPFIKFSKKDLWLLISFS